MENLSRYTKKLQKGDKFTVEQAHQIMMLKMIITKVKHTLNIKTDKELADKLGFKVATIKRACNKGVIPNGFIESICFIMDISKSDFNKIYQDKVNDEYINIKGHLIIDGVDYGKITE